MARRHLLRDAGAADRPDADAGARPCARAVHQRSAARLLARCTRARARSRARLVVWPPAGVWAARWSPRACQGSRSLAWRTPPCASSSAASVSSSSWAVCSRWCSPSAVAAPSFLAMEHAQPGYLKYYLLQRHVLGSSPRRSATAKRCGTTTCRSCSAAACRGFSTRRSRSPVSARVRGTTRRTSGFGDATRLGWSLLLTGTLFLSLSKSKLLTYALPVFPGDCAARGGRVARVVRTRTAGNIPRAGLRGCRRCRPCIGALLLPAALVFAPAKFPVPHVAWLWVVAAGHRRRLVDRAPRVWRLVDWTGQRRSARR